MRCWSAGAVRQPAPWTGEPEILRPTGRHRRPPRWGGDLRAAARAAGTTAVCALALTLPGCGDAPDSVRAAGTRPEADRLPDRPPDRAPEKGTNRPGPAPEAAVPVRVRVPAIGVAAPVGPLATGSDGTLPPPESPGAAGWWRDGPEPGEPGPAVLVGHYDSATGPAVFHRLAELRPGDRVAVDRADGTAVSFTVRGVAAHRRDAFPTDRVYGGTGGRPALRLITCAGRYDRAAGRYTENLVVLATAAPPDGSRG
ncbi:class F sortase [Streptomyces sp. TRM 70361]|uniref:class F sortase n=1 Tax=Streptomyces sp. TRM 70361 TaxID=3116553 RepID=UPI002E7BBCBF|nr:class F sortase [Streptomyces sp. TRM 70361]MEE1941989.1 class F sortase [Streptomyces sp. TRM 70361]